MAAKKLKEFLNDQHVKYTSMAHSPAFTSQEIAASAHVSGYQLAKVVIVKIGGKFAMVVMSANDQINFAKLREALGVPTADLASESEFKDKFYGCEIGAMPPFGNLYDMPVYVSNHLAQERQISFNAESHSELMQIDFADFERLVKPKVVAI